MAREENGRVFGVIDH